MPNIQYVSEQEIPEAYKILQARVNALGVCIWCGFKSPDDSEHSIHSKACVASAQASRPKAKHSTEFYSK